MKESFLVFGAPAIGEGEIAEVEACLRSGWIGTGPRVAQFEQDFARYQKINSSQVAALNSCTAALHVALLAASLPAGGEVITTPLTFCATVNAIVHAGLTPVLADVNSLTQNIDPDAIEAAITANTCAILPVHFAGRACEMNAIMRLAQKHQLAVIEDCAHAIETTYHNQKVGTFGDFGCFSFYATKNITTGEGGMLIGKSESQMARAKTLALHGMSKDAWHRFGDKGYKHYQVAEAGFKYNMMDLQAAIGLHQLVRIEASWQRRQVIWQQYMRAFAGLPVNLPAAEEPNSRHAYHLFTLGIDEERTAISRDEFLTKMDEQQIGVGVHYLSIPEHEYYQQRFGWRPEQYPNAMTIGRQTVSLPLSPALTDEDVTRVINAVQQAFYQN